VETVRLDEGLRRTVAPSGLVVVSERLPGLRSAAVGVWVRAASAHEVPEQLGAAHLLEHLVFKGTERRDAHELALALEVRGGSLDAFTGRDTTSYQAHVLDADLPLAVEVLTDLVRGPLLREADLKLEREVVLEEIAGVEDAPEELAFDLHAGALWPDHPYGRSILGTRETVGALRAEDLRRLHTSGYFAGNCVIAAAGNVHHEQLLTVLEREGWFDGSGNGAAQRWGPPAPAPAVRGRVEDVPRDTAQVHLVLGTDTFAYTDPRRFALSMLVNALGGGMSSRLFQRVREELGLAYAVYAYRQSYQSAGQLGIYVGTRRDTAEQALAEIRSELARVAAESLPAPELADARQQLKGQIMLSLESPSSRMSRLASLELHGEAYRPLDALLAEVDAVTPDTVAAVAREYFAPERQTVLRLGPV
jgi:predicted Zn-dependent peptidase